MKKDDSHEASKDVKNVEDSAEGTEKKDGAQKSSTEKNNVEPIARARAVANEGIEAAREKLGVAAEEVGRRYEKVSGDVRRGAERASEAARERYAVASESVRDGYQRARRDAVDLGDEMTVYIRDNPGKSVMIAAGLGFLIALAFGPRGGRRS